MEAFKNREGINLGLLAQKLHGLPCRFRNDDKMYFALSLELEDKANDLYERALNDKEAALSVRKKYFFTEIDFIMKDLIARQIDNEIENMMDKIIKLRNSHNAASDESIDEFWHSIDPIYDSLQNRISAKYIGRDEVINSYMKLDQGLNCWNRLNDECRNMLITAEIVYKTLSERADSKELDYSPAMIPLTKVVEYLLNQVFNKIKPFINFDNDFRIKNDYRDDNFRRIFGDSDDSGWKPKDSIELGPCIKMLCNGNINLNSHEVLYESKWFCAHGKNRRQDWHVDNFINWSKLSRFVPEIIQCNAFNDPKGKNTKKFAFSNDVETNRLIFITSLEYVKNAYRNQVAHKNGIDKPKMDECRDNMILAKKLIWILIYIMN